jgi:hypothetical protein
MTTSSLLTVMMSHVNPYGTFSLDLDERLAVT